MSAIEQIGWNGRFDRFLLHKYASESLDPDGSLAATLPSDISDIYFKDHPRRPINSNK